MEQTQEWKRKKQILNFLFIIKSHWTPFFLLRTEFSDTHNKFNKCDEQQQNRAHISSFHRVNLVTTRQLCMRRLTSERLIFRFFFLLINDDDVVVVVVVAEKNVMSVFALEKPTSKSRNWTNYRNFCTNILSTLNVKSKFSLIFPFGFLSLLHFSSMNDGFDCICIRIPHP